MQPEHGVSAGARHASCARAWSMFSCHDCPKSASETLRWSQRKQTVCAPVLQVAMRSNVVSVKQTWHS